MNAIAIEHDETVGEAFVPAFWWFNVSTKEVQSGEWVKESEKELHEPKGYYDQDFEAEIAMNNYEREWYE